MCIVNSYVRSLKSTKILVVQYRETKEQSNTLYQLTCYSNQVELGDDKNNAMILPVPCESSNDIVVLDTRENWSEQVMKYIYHYYGKPTQLDPPRSRSLSLSASKTLKIESAGSYHFSRANSLVELQQYDRDQFRVSAEAFKYLSLHYPTGYCFLILALNRSGEYHPFCYRYPLKPHQHNIFIPTRHFHPPRSTQSKNNSTISNHENHRSAESSISPSTALPDVGNISSVKKSREFGDYDHELYIIGCGPDSVFTLDEVNVHLAILENMYEIDGPTTCNKFQGNMEYVIKTQLTRYGQHHNIQLCYPYVYRWIIKGEDTNGDVFVGPVRRVSTHVNLICDICNETLKGTRYNCMDCYDIDVCEKCHSLQRHHEVTNFKLAKNRRTNHVPGTHRLVELWSNAHAKPGSVVSGQRIKSHRYAPY